MGLDLVELVYSVEEEFGIDIPDEVAVTITTPKKLIDYVMSLPKIRSGTHPRDFIADKVWTMIENEGGIERKDYNEDSRFIEDMGMG